ncbi:hypothetical protein POKO110462_21825 [Pontibacter korlensis]|uniref:Uncharacterized protein n=1 Tax=Pontibacter korlensis TaxID=400092 RepID=A0A0E3ZDB5_9BACT|nr:hypothetical protein PKOR_02280 [Pontibacter korlensis]
MDNGFILHVILMLGFPLLQIDTLVEKVLATVLGFVATGILAKYVLAGCKIFRGPNLVEQSTIKQQSPAKTAGLCLS